MKAKGGKPVAKKWELHIGCYRETLVSRDSEARNHNSLEECKEDMARSEEFWKSVGYTIWFAYAIGPNGEKIQLHPDAS